MVCSDTASAPLFERTYGMELSFALMVDATLLPRQCGAAAGAGMTGLDPAEFLSLVGRRRWRHPRTTGAKSSSRHMPVGGRCGVGRSGGGPPRAPSS